LNEVKSQPDEVGTKDKVIGLSSSEVLVGKTTNTKLVKVDNRSHALPVEMSRTFNKEVLNRLKTSSAFNLL
jgi:hypothetical protein